MDGMTANKFDSSGCHEGLQVYAQAGRYGVMLNGRPTCRAVFREIRRLSRDSRFFALGIYPIKDHVRRVTVIDRHGQDLNVRLFGEVTQEGDFFRSDCNTAQPIYWDSVSGTYSYEKPYIKEVGGLQLISTIDGNWMLRRGTGRVSPRFLDNELLFKSDGILVEREGGYGFHLVKANGRMGTCYKRIPAEVRMVPDVRSLGLIRKQKG